MAADVQIRRWNGIGPTKTDVSGTNIRHRMDDELGVSGSASALAVPAAGTAYSYWVTLGLYVVGGTFGTLNNIVAFTDGVTSHPAGVTTVIGRATSYVMAAGLQLNTTNHAGLPVNPVDAFTLTSAAPLSIPGTITSPTTGDVGDLLVFQMQVASTAAAGTIPAETLSYQWDES